MTKTPSDLTRSVTDQLRRLLSGDPSPQSLEASYRLLAKWRSVVLENTIVQRQGTEVLSGPFKGMSFPLRASEGARSARLLGVYETTLVPVIETIIGRGYPQVLDVGCAEGYYAVGLARRMPDSRIIAHDIDPKAQARCTELARINQVSDRIVVNGELSHDGFGICNDQPTLVICDIEGAEDMLLDPVAAPALVQADILVEVHDCFKPGLSDTLSQRFAETHTVTRFDRDVDMAALPDWMESLSDLDRLTALWEWRMGPTPWLWLETKTGCAADCH